MDKIGTSHIATVDLVIWGGAILLIFLLRYPPRNHLLAGALPWLAGAMVVALGTVIASADLSGGVVIQLAMLAIYLCISLLNWHNERKANAYAETPSELPHERA